MKKLILFSFVVLSILQSNAQTPTWQWAKSAGGTSNDYGSDITIDGSGNVYVTGYFCRSSITFGSIILNNQSIGTSTNGADFYIVKYDALGNVLWAKSAGGAFEDGGKAVATDATGNVYVTGTFGGSSITFGTITLTNSGSSDIFVVKYDASGNVIWAKSSGGPGTDIANDIAVDANSNVYITGGSGIVLVVKYNTSGTVLWTKSAGGTGNSYGNSISTDLSGNIYLTGAFAGAPLIFGTTTLNTVGTWDIFVVKYDASGNVIWAKSAGGTDVDYGRSISYDASGSVFVTGDFRSTSISFGTNNLYNVGIPSSSSDIFVVKYDPSGNVVWAKSGGGTSYDYGNGISTDGSGNVAITGEFKSSTITFGSNTLTKVGGSNLFVVKYSNTGNVLWAIKAGGTQDNIGNSIFSDVNGNNYLTGSFNSPSILFGSTTLNNTTPTIAGTDVFVAKLGSISTYITEKLSKSLVSIYPNPAYTKISIGGLTKNDKTITLTNVLGATIKTIETNENEMLEINIENLAPGVYFIKINSNLYKFIKS